MAEIDNSLIFEVPKKLQGDMAQGFGRMDERFLHLEERMNDLEKGQTASMHFEQAVLSHLSSIHGSMAEIRARMVGFDRRLNLAEAR